MSLEDLTPAEQQQLRLGKLLLESNPDIALDAKRLAKKADPRLRLPEVDLQDQIEQLKKENQEQVDKAERRRIEERVAAREMAAKKLIEDAGFSLEEIEKIVKEEGLHGEGAIGTALKLATLQRQSVEPGPMGANYAGPMEIRGDPNLRKMSVGDLRRWSSSTGHEMIDAFHKRMRSGR